MRKGRLRRALEYAGMLAALVLLTPVAAAARRAVPSLRGLWLVMERGDDARDNGYWFYRFLRMEHPEINARYVITPDSPDAARAEALGGTVRYRSLRHLLMYLCADVLAGTHVYPAAPDRMMLYHLAQWGICARGRQVFLRHGVLKDEMRWQHRDALRVDLFACGAAPEYAFIRDTFGHPAGVVRYLGLCRFDALLTAGAPRREILLMPTWRGAGYPCGDDFPQTAFFRHYQGLLQSPALHALLEEADCTLIFYPHVELQGELRHFSADSPRIVLADRHTHDVQDLLMRCCVLVTDYSSVFFDAAYIGRSVIYDQFDEAQFRACHYEAGYFDYERDGFGPVCRTEQALIEGLRACARRGFAAEDVYAQRVRRFFPLHDAENCRRTFEAVLSLL